MKNTSSKIREIERQLQASEIRYRRLFETAKDGIVIFDMKTAKIVDANPFMTQMLGYDYEYFIGKELWEIGVFNNKESSQDAYQILRDAGFIRFEDLPLKTNKQTKIEVEFVCNVYEESGGIQVAQCNIRDITQRRKLEEQTKEQAKMLAEASYRKDEFLSLLAHELRNPLAPLASALHMLQLPNVPKSTEVEMYAIMERQIYHLTRLIDDLLDMARITTKSITLHVEKTELKNLVKDAVEMSRPLIDSEDHTLTVSLPNEPVVMEVDPVRIVQVLTNLLNNAAKFTPKNGLITVSAQCKGNDVVIKVKDNGIGIESNKIQYIFEMFSKVDSSITRAQGGLGIGLSLVKNIIELHGGEVTAYSAGLGKGSEFTIWLPLTQQKNKLFEKEK